MKQKILTASLICLFFSCSKKDSTSQPPPVVPTAFDAKAITINGNNYSSVMYNVNLNSEIKIAFTAALNKASVITSVSIKSNNATVSYTSSFENNDSTLVITPVLSALTKNIFSITTNLKSTNGGSLKSALTVTLITQIDSTDKFNRISDSALLTLIQQQTFKYFWDFGHPTSGMARERNSSGDVCTTGGTGFGIMSMIIAANRKFVSRTDALSPYRTR